MTKRKGLTRMPKTKSAVQPKAKPIAPAVSIEKAIYVIREQRVMLDQELAGLYGVPTGRLNEAVKRNSGRFPEDFAFRLTQSEADNLISQIAISRIHGGRRSAPMAFTEQGVAMPFQRAQQ